MTALVAVVNAEPGLGIAEITARLRGPDQPVGFRDRDVSKASLRAEQHGLIQRVTRGPGKKTEHHPATPSNPVPTPSRDGFQPTPSNPVPTPSLDGVPTPRPPRL